MSATWFSIFILILIQEKGAIALLGILGTGNSLVFLKMDIVVIRIISPIFIFTAW